MKRWFRSRVREGAAETPIESARFVALDTELTSLNARTNRLLSVGAIGMVGSRILIGEHYYQVVNPGITLPPEAVVIHRLRPEDVERGNDLSSAITELKSFIGDAVLVAHFAKIDRSILCKEFASLGTHFENHMICTARVHEWIVRRSVFKQRRFQDVEGTDLVSLAKAFGLDIRELHNALDDAFVTAQLWQRQIHLLSELGVSTMQKLLRFAKV